MRLGHRHRRLTPIQSPKNVSMTDILQTDWTKSLARGAAPDAAALRDHLLAIHRDYPGFTESCAGGCRDAQGRTSYAWLAEAVEADRHRVLLDIACGSGALLQHCHATLPPTLRMIGVDMSPDELALAADRLPAGRAELQRGWAQSLDFLEDGVVDVALCHWALTLMDPVVPVLREIARVLTPGGRFAAIVDGASDAARGYGAVHDLIYSHVQATLPAYGQCELGDPRIRRAEDLTAVVQSVFPDAAIRIETAVVSMTGPADVVAAEAAGFFYAAFVLTAPAHANMLDALSALLVEFGPGEGLATFSMPINRLIVEVV